MNIQRLSESLYHIWKLRLEGQLTFAHGNNPDYLPASIFEEVVQHTRIVEDELNSVFFTREVSAKFDKAVAEIKFKMPYVKSINRSGLFVHPIVGNKEEVERRREMINTNIKSLKLKRQYIELLNKEFRNAFQ
uniref:Uncharacterized protein n=2 Tax=unclassified Rosemountvirus TaxID=2738372 RepID=A0AAU8GFT0_9CAUD